MIVRQLRPVANLHCNRSFRLIGRVGAVAAAGIATTGRRGPPLSPNFENGDAELVKNITVDTFPVKTSSTHGLSTGDTTPKVWRKRIDPGAGHFAPQRRILCCSKMAAPGGYYRGSCSGQINNTKTQRTQHWSRRWRRDSSGQICRRQGIGNA